MKTVEVVMLYPGGARFIAPALWARNGLGVAEGRYTGLWSLTHLASGLCVAKFTSKTDALGCARKIVGLARWTDEKPKITKKARRKIWQFFALFEGER